MMNFNSMVQLDLCIASSRVLCKVSVAELPHPMGHAQTKPNEDIFFFSNLWAPNGRHGKSQ